MAPKTSLFPPNRQKIRRAEEARKNQIKTMGDLELTADMQSQFVGQMTQEQKDFIGGKNPEKSKLIEELTYLDDPIAQYGFDPDRIRFQEPDKYQIQDVWGSNRPTTTDANAEYNPGSTKTGPNKKDIEKDIIKYGVKLGSSKEIIAHEARHRGFQLLRNMQLEGSEEDQKAWIEKYGREAAGLLDIYFSRNPRHKFSAETINEIRDRPDAKFNPPKFDAEGNPPNMGLFRGGDRNEAIQFVPLEDLRESKKSGRIQFSGVFNDLDGNFRAGISNEFINKAFQGLDKAAKDAMKKQKDDYRNKMTIRSQEGERKFANGGSVEDQTGQVFKGMGYGEIIADNLIGLDNEYESLGEKIGKQFNQDEAAFLKKMGVGMYEGAKDFISAPIETTKEVFKEFATGTTNLLFKDLDTRLQEMFKTDYNNATPEQVTKARESVLGDAVIASGILPAGKVIGNVVEGAVDIGTNAARKIDLSKVNSAMARANEIAEDVEGKIQQSPVGTLERKLRYEQMGKGRGKQNSAQTAAALNLGYTEIGFHSTRRYNPNEEIEVFKLPDEVFADRAANKGITLQELLDNEGLTFNNKNNAHDFLGVHVGTTKAAADRFSDLSFEKGLPEMEGSRTYQLRLKTNKPFLDGKKPWTEKGLNTFLVKEMNKIKGGQVFEKMQLVRRRLAEQGYTHVPYINNVEDKRNISYAMLVDRPEGGGVNSSAVIRYKDAEFNPLEKFNRNAKFAQGGVAMKDQMSLAFNKGGDTKEIQPDLLDKVTDFFSRERGLERSEKLEDAIRYYLGPYAGSLGQANQLLNPIVGLQDAGEATREGRYVDAITDTAAAALPIAGAKAVKPLAKGVQSGIDKAVDAVTEIMTGGTFDKGRREVLGTIVAAPVAVAAGSTGIVDELIAPLAKKKEPINNNENIEISTPLFDDPLSKMTPANSPSEPKIISFSKKQDDKKLQKFSKELSSTIAERASKMGELVGELKEAGIYGDYNVGAVVQGQNIKGDPKPFTVEGQSLQKVKLNNPTLRRTEERLGMKFNYIEKDGDYYIAMLNIAQKDADGITRTQAYLDAIKHKEYPVLSGPTGSVPKEFNKGGTTMKDQMEMSFALGGVAETVDPVSGNDVPPGSLPEEVRDDIPARLSEGEYVVPADVVRYYGVKFFEDLRTQAKMGLTQMDADGRIGGEPMDMASSEVDIDALIDAEMNNMNAGGLISGYAPGGLAYGYGYKPEVKEIVPTIDPLAVETPPSVVTPVVSGQTSTGFTGVKTFYDAQGRQISVQFVNNKPQRSLQGLTEKNPFETITTPNIPMGEIVDSAESTTVSREEPKSFSQNLEEGFGAPLGKRAKLIGELANNFKDLDPDSDDFGKNITSQIKSFDRMFSANPKNLIGKTATAGGLGLLGLASLGMGMRDQALARATGLYAKELGYGEDIYDAIVEQIGKGSELTDGDAIVRKLMDKKIEKSDFKDEEAYDTYKTNRDSRAQTTQNFGGRVSQVQMVDEDGNVSNNKELRQFRTSQDKRDYEESAKQRSYVVENSARAKAREKNGQAGVDAFNKKQALKEANTNHPQNKDYQKNKAKDNTKKGGTGFFRGSDSSGNTGNAGGYSCYVATALNDNGYWNLTKKIRLLKWCMDTKPEGKLDTTLWRNGYCVFGKEVVAPHVHNKYIQWLSNGFYDSTVKNKNTVQAVLGKLFFYVPSYTIGLAKALTGNLKTIDRT